MKGVIWRVGDGKTIRITKDHWIKNSSRLKPIAPIPEDLNVNALIDETTGCWNVEMIQSYFNEDDAKNILQIPLCHTHCDDFPAWSYSKSGIYTVKSAYSLTRLERFHSFLSENGKGETSDLRETSRLWKRLWAIRAPPK